jgi:hypothetical protein
MTPSPTVLLVDADNTLLGFARQQWVKFPGR